MQERSDVRQTVTDAVIAMSSDQCQAPQNIEPPRHSEGAEQRSQHDRTGREYAFMSHISCHHIAAHRCRRSKHDQDRHELLFPESKPHSHRKEERCEAHQLHHSGCDRRLCLSERFLYIKGSSHRHQSQRCCRSPDIRYRLFQDRRHGESEGGPEKPLPRSPV